MYLVWTLILAPAHHMAANRKLAVCVNFTSPVAIRKNATPRGHATATCQDARGLWCLPLRFGTNPLSVQHKHFCRVNMFTKLWSLMKYAPSDSPLLVNMFSHLRHCKHRCTEKHVRFIFSVELKIWNDTDPPSDDTCPSAWPQYYINRCQIVSTS